MKPVAALRFGDPQQIADIDRIAFLSEAVLGWFSSFRRRNYAGQPVKEKLCPFCSRAVEWSERRVQQMMKSGPPIQWAHPDCINLANKELEKLREQYGVPTPERVEDRSQLAILFDLRREQP